MKSKLLLKGILSSLLFAIIFYKIDWENLYDSAVKVNWIFITITLFLNALGVLISVIKWKLFLELKGIFQPIHKLHSLYYVGYFFNNFLPTTMGGDFIRIMNTSKKGGFADAFSAVFCERSTGLITILFLACTAGFINLYRDIPIGISWLAFFTLFLASSFLIIILLTILLRSNALTFRCGSSLLTPVIRIIEAIMESVKSPKTLIITFLLSIIFHILLVMNCYLFAKSIGLNLDIIILAVIFPVAMLAAMIPISINGLGVQEGSLIFLLGQIGVTAEDSLLIAMLSRLFIILGSILGWIFYISLKDSLITKD